MLVIPKTQRLIQLQDIIDNLLDGGSLRLYQNDYTPTVDSLLADFTVCDYTGYANKTVAAWGAPFLDPTSLATTITPIQTFARTAGATTNLAYGAYYLDVNGDLCWATRFDAPVNFAVAGDTLNLIGKYQHGNLS